MFHHRAPTEELRRQQAIHTSREFVGEGGVIARVLVHPFSKPKEPGHEMHHHYPRTLEL